MIVRTCVAAGTYASFVSLLSLGGSWGLPLAAAPFASVEAPGTARPVTRSPWLPASAGRPSEQPERFRLKAEVTYAERGDQVTLPVRAARIERRDASRGVENAVAALRAGTAEHLQRDLRMLGELLGHGNLRQTSRCEEDAPGEFGAA